MYGGRGAALARRTDIRREMHVREKRQRMRHNGGTGPVHRAGPMWHDPALWEVDDPAAYLMAPAVDFHAKARHVARGMVLLAASFSTTPALPALLGLS